MPIIHIIPASLCNAVKTISIIKGLSAEHGIPESLSTDNVPQFVNALFVEFETEWQFDHNTGASRNPRGNVQTYAAMKIINGFLTHAKCSGQDPCLALLAYHRTSINAHLHSPAECLYPWALHATVPQDIQNTDPHAAPDQDHLNECASQSTTYHYCCGCKKKSPLIARQTVSFLNNARNLWLPVTIIQEASNGSYLVKLLVEDSTTVPTATFMNVTQMSSVQIHPSPVMGHPVHPHQDTYRHNPLELS